MTAPRVLVAGVGNILFGDDGFGCEVARRLLRCSLPESVCVVDFGIRAFDLGCALAEGHDLAILVDAMSRGGPPGTLHVIEPLLSPAGALDAHALSPATALDLAAALGGRPAEVRVIGCEPASFGPEGEGLVGLSAEVEAAVDEAVAMTMAMALAALQKSGSCFRRSPSQGKLAGRCNG